MHQYRYGACHLTGRRSSIGGTRDGGRGAAGGGRSTGVRERSAVKAESTHEYNDSSVNIDSDRSMTASVWWRISMEEWKKKKKKQ